MISVARGPHVLVPDTNESTLVARVLAGFAGFFGFGLRKNLVLWIECGGI